MIRWTIPLILLATVDLLSAEDPAVDFSSEILPILSDRCFHCHGPDESHRKADLRLDEESAAKAVIEAGFVERSALIQRITSQDPEEVMPPPDSHRKPLGPNEIALLRKWIDQGAPWGKHWAFTRPVRPSLPDASAHPIDAFVKARLKRETLSPSQRAPFETLLRRLSYDLTGLPLVAAQVEGSTWEETIDHVLESPHYGERMAMWWLDAARYADTDGYQGDAERANWPWRDWVVDAFNGNMPFDQFTIEQFAGDLLPEASPEQILATCFHRNHMTNGEGGRLPEESRIDYVIDRVNTMGTVWLGLTLGCTQCHTHKFDPVSHEDYYRLFAYFDSIDEDGKAGNAAKPYLNYQSAETEALLAKAEAFVKKCEEREAAEKDSSKERFEGWLETQKASLPSDYRAWHIVEPVALESAEGTRLDHEEGGVVQAHGPNPVQDDYQITYQLPTPLTRLTGWKLEVFPHPTHSSGRLSRGRSGEFILTNVKLYVRKRGQSQVRDIEMVSAMASFEKNASGRNYGKVKDTLNDDPRNGWTTEGGDPTKPHTAVFALEETLTLSEDEELMIILFHRSTLGDANIGRFRISMTDQAGETVRSLATAPLEELAASGTADDGLLKRLFAQFLVDEEAYQTAKERVAIAKRQLGRAKKATGEINVMVLAERAEPRSTHILERGVWDAKGKVVTRGVLPAVHDIPAEAVPTRLELAKWLVSPENPLTARVVANHLWQLVFGAGLVRTPEDFGLQGDRPTHPDLLDWLAVELVECGWDIKHMIRLLVTSETYQQASVISPDAAEADPKNLWWARAMRYRRPAWMIRDGALQLSGLLNTAFGGAPVKPYQPDGVWYEMFMGRFRYEPSIGPEQYRRTLYAFWRRSAAPTFLFDSAQRRVCEVSPRRTNTPLHALTLLNDLTMLESSRTLAERFKDLGELFQQVLGREASTQELTVIKREYDRALETYKEDHQAALAFVTIGQLDRPEKSSTIPNIAARMVVASMLLNLDEAITHE